MVSKIDYSRVKKMYVDKEFFQNLKIISVLNGKTMIETSHSLVPMLKEYKETREKEVSKKNVFGFKI